jgi:multidrug transporter EmrE-like cation transporter
MPTIVIVLMFLVVFLLAVIAMILMPILGVGYALWSKTPIVGSDYVAGMCYAEFEPKSRSNDLRRRFE